MSWQAYTAISVLTLSASVLLQRVLLCNHKTNPYAYVVVFQGIVGLILMAFAMLAGFELPGITKVWQPAVLSIIAFGLGHIMYAKTLQLVEASAFSVLFATQAIWIMLLGIVLFNESMSLLQIVGTILIFSSVGLVAKNPRSLSIDKGTLYGLLTGLLFGIAITSWSYVGRHTDGLSWAAISFVGTSLVALAIKPSASRKLRSLVTASVLPKLLLLGFLYAVGSLTMLYAYQQGTFSEVTPLRQTSIIVTTLLALVFLVKERSQVAIKLSAAAICLLGALLIII